MSKKILCGRFVRGFCFFTFINYSDSLPLVWYPISPQNHHPGGQCIVCPGWKHVTPAATASNTAGGAVICEWMKSFWIQNRTVFDALPMMTMLHTLRHVWLFHSLELVFPHSYIQDIPRPPWLWIGPCTRSWWVHCFFSCWDTTKPTSRRIEGMIHWCSQWDAQDVDLSWSILIYHDLSWLVEAQAKIRLRRNPLNVSE